MTKRLADGLQENDVPKAKLIMEQEVNVYPLLARAENLLFHQSDDQTVIPDMRDIHNQIRIRVQDEDVESKESLIDEFGQDLGEVDTLKPAAAERIMEEVWQHYNH